MQKATIIKRLKACQDRLIKDRRLTNWDINELVGLLDRELEYVDEHDEDDLNRFHHRAIVVAE